MADRIERDLKLSRSVQNYLVHRQGSLGLLKPEGRVQPLYKLRLSVVKEWFRMLKKLTRRESFFFL
jgi:hypothetical protein